MIFGNYSAHTARHGCTGWPLNVLTRRFARQQWRAWIETFAMPPTPQTPIPVTTNMRRVRAMAACLLLQLLLGLLFTALGLPEPWLLAAQWVMGLVLASMALALCLLPLLWLFS